MLRKLKLKNIIEPKGYMKGLTNKEIEKAVRHGVVAA